MGETYIVIVVVEIAVAAAKEYPNSPLKMMPNSLLNKSFTTTSIDQWFIE
jgi:hypothetical protein